MNNYKCPQMIYCHHPEMFPKEGIIEQIIYNDENGFQWLIARVEKGFYVKYNGNEYFCENRFCCSLSDGSEIQINNTNCIFIQDTDFETFAEVRNVIKIGYTDEIWEVFQEMFEERFEHDQRVNEWELINQHP